MGVDRFWDTSIIRMVLSDHSFAAGVLDRPQRNAPTGNGLNSVNASSLPYLEVL